MNKQIKIWMIAVLAVLVVLVGIGSAALALFDNGVFQVILNGEAEITLEYGEAYIEQGAYSYFSSAVYGEKVVEEGLQPEGELDTGILGTYTLTYRSKYAWHKASAQRKIHVVDTQKPTITLVYNSDSYTLPGREYEEEGFRAEDNYDGDITDKVVRTVKGDTVIYKVSDSSGNTAEVTRTIQYGDFDAPQLTLKGEENITLQAGTKFEEPGYSAVDNVDGDITAKVKVEGTVNTNIAGTYTIKYTVTDSYGNTAEKTRTIVVEPRKQPDVVNPTGKVIYLTFDDGPSRYTSELLAVLEKYNVKATFFVVNTGYLHLLDDIVSGGHAIGMHSVTHEYSEIYASEDAFFNDLHKMQSIIYDKTGVNSTLMRFPGGSSNGISKNYCKGIMTRLTKAVQDQGYQYFDWNVDSKDAGGAKTADEVFNNVTSGCSKRKVSVVLQHDIKGFSVDAVERIINWGLDNGYTFLPLEPTSPVCHHQVNN